VKKLPSSWKYARLQGEGVLIGDLPSFTIGKGIAGAGLLSTIVIQKYLDHLPLYRQIEQFKRLGVAIPASTMSDWVAMCLDLLEPLYETLKRKIITCGYLQADETPIKVLDRNIKGKTHLGSYWVYRDPVSGLVLFDYRKSRGREGPREILENFEGFLQSDGWSAYPGFDNEKITLFHCMAHARRYFEQAKENKPELSQYALTEIQKLYAIERCAREEKLNHDQRRYLRQKEALPILNHLHQWLKENIMKELPASAIGKALSYSLKRWEKLMLYTNDGKLEIDNNLVENSIRPIAIGRKNYLFAGSHQAAQRAAMIYSLLGSCKLKGVEPFEWLRNIFEILPDFKANRLEELLP
jgi:transposase